VSIFLGIDIGTSATKTIAVNADGKVIANSSKSYSCDQPRVLWSEQDPEDWWQATVETVRSVMVKAGLKAADVKAIGLSGQMHGAVFLDRDDKVIRPAILWNDQRTGAECDEIEARAGGRKNLVKLVANPALTGFTAPKILWLRKNEPRNFAATCKILLPKDDVRRRLTGDYATDVSDASGTLLLNVAERKWSKELLDRLDLDIDLLPRCYESAEVTGKLTAKIAELLGLSTDCLVVGGAGDCPAGAIGNGIVKTGMASTIIGTSSVVIMHTDDFAIEPEGRLHTMCHAVPGKYFMMGVNLSGGGSLQWFRDRLCQTDFNASNVNFYDVLSDEAKLIRAGSEGLIFLPYLSGERSPHNDPHARGSFIGLSLSHTRGHMVRALMEGVAYNMQNTLSLLQEVGQTASEIRVSGGGSQSAVWRSIQADVFGRSVCRINSDQGPAYGVALLAGVGAGYYASVEEACQSIKVVEETACDAERAKYYERAFPLFKKLYRSLKEDFREIAALEEERRPAKV
jgi:xylulokinase